MAKQLQTFVCEVCGRERPVLAMGVYNGVKHCNDNHNDTNCHERVKDANGS